MSDDAVYAALAERFPAADHKKVNKGGRDQTYIPWTDKVERFNKVLGHDWSFRVVREGMTNTEAWVLGELSVTVNGVTTVRQQYGCENILMGRNETPVGDLFKKAGTDALSKAASLFGCGLYLSIADERADVEAEMREIGRPKALASTSNARTTAPSSPAVVPAPTPNAVHDAAVLTGANPTVDQGQRWARLVMEAERVSLPTLATVKAIDTSALSENQLKSYADRLENRLYEAREKTGAA